MTNMILTSECEQCMNSAINDENKAKVTIYFMQKTKHTIGANVFHVIVYKLNRILKREMSSFMGKVKSIHENQYIIFDNKARHLLDLGFKYDESEDKYVYIFPVLIHEKNTVLCGGIIAYADTNEIQIDVMDNNFAPYAPFYNIECGNYDVILNRINKVVLNEFSKLNITKKNVKDNYINEVKHNKVDENRNNTNKTASR